jgi:DNA polymerase-4
VRDRAALGAVFTRLCEQVAADLQRKGYMGRTIGVKLRFADFRIATRDHTIAGYTDQAAAIRHAAGQALKRAPLEQRLRLLGVRVGGLMPTAQAAAIGSGPALATPHDDADAGDAAQQALLF